MNLGRSKQVKSFIKKEVRRKIIAMKDLPEIEERKIKDILQKKQFLIAKRRKKE